MTDAGELSLTEEASQSSFSIFDSDLDEEACWDDSTSNEHTRTPANMVNHSDTGVDTSASSTLSDRTHVESGIWEGKLSIESIPDRMPVKKIRDRKMAKQMTERKRRDRINSLLDTLRKLILQLLHKNPRHHRKLEKADILELVVSYLRRDLTQKQRKLCNINQIPSNKSLIDSTQQWTRKETQERPVTLLPVVGPNQAETNNSSPSIIQCSPLPVYYPTSGMPIQFPSHTTSRRPLGSLNLSTSHFYEYPSDPAPLISVHPSEQLTYWGLHSGPVPIPTSMGSTSNQRAVHFTSLDSPSNFSSTYPDSFQTQHVSKLKENIALSSSCSGAIRKRIEASTTGLWRPYM